MCRAIVLLIKPFVLPRSRCRCHRGLLKKSGKEGKRAGKSGKLGGDRFGVQKARDATHTALEETVGKEGRM